MKKSKRKNYKEAKHLLQSNDEQSSSQTGKGNSMHGTKA
jgi:hypothetical protein